MPSFNAIETEGAFRLAKIALHATTARDKALAHFAGGADVPAFEGFAAGLVVFRIDVLKHWRAAHRGGTGVICGVNQRSPNLHWENVRCALGDAFNVLRKAFLQLLVTLDFREARTDLDLTEFIGLAVTVGNGMAGADCVTLRDLVLAVAPLAWTIGSKPIPQRR